MQAKFLLSLHNEVPDWSEIVEKRDEPHAFMRISPLFFDLSEQIKGKSTHLYIHPPGGDVLLIHTTRPLRTENSLLNDVLKSRKPFITNQSSLKIIIIFIDY